MATDVLLGTSNMGLINTETRFGEDTISPGLVEDLQKFYDKTESLQDKAKCLELITSVQLGETVKDHALQRPHSAMPVVGQDHSKNYLSPYQTSYNRDYPLKKPLDTVAVRPMTSQGFLPQKDSPVTNYSEEFKKKNQRPITPLRPGSASGNRVNRPHPPQSFLVWKFPQRSADEQPQARWSEELTNDMINQVHRRLCQSTYQTDYMGLPQGFQVKSAYQLPPDWKENIPYSLDSIQRYCYQNHAQPPELTLPSTRYGSNRKKQLPASGTIPTASARQMHIRSRTTYDRHYNDNADAVTQQIRELGYKLGAEALRKYYDKATGEDRTMVRNILEAYSGKPVSPSPVPAPHPPAMSARPPSGRPPARMSYRSNTPASTPISTPYVPLPAPKAPDSKLSFTAYKAPTLLD